MSEPQQPALDTARVKHLEFIQNTIARVAQQSFATRSLAAIVISATATYSITAKNPDLIYGGIIAAIAFWLLDSYYLYIERSYRQLFDYVRTNSGPSNFDMSITRYLSESAYLRAATSRTIALIYLLLLGLQLGAHYYAR